MNRTQALDAIEQACLQKAQLRFEDFEATMCSCARGRVAAEFQENADLNAIADLERIEVEMGKTDTNDFQTLEQLRRRYNGVIARLNDASRSAHVSTALHDAVRACREPASP